MTSMTSRWPSVPLRHRVCRGHKHESTCKEDIWNHDCDLSVYEERKMRSGRTVFIHKLLRNKGS